MLRTSKHFLQDLNCGKRSALKSFIIEYRRVAKLIVQDIWVNGYIEYTKAKSTEPSELAGSSQPQLIKHEFNPAQSKYDLLKYLDYSRFSQIKTNLSARALSSLVTQLSGVLRAVTIKQQRRLMVYQVKPNPKLAKAIENFTTTCPDTSRLNPELSSKCVDFTNSSNYHLHGHLRLKFLGKISATYGSIIIPLVRHRHSKNFEVNNWTRKNSFLVHSDRIEIRWEKKIELKKTGKKVGADQGQTTVLTLSDGQITKADLHGHDLKSICTKIARKTKGSKAFARVQQHRQNYINWSVKQLTLTNIKELRYEQVRYLRYGKRVSASLCHFTYPLIEKQIVNLCELNGVRLILEDSVLYSQRCSRCGWVHKSNRQGKLFTCRSCQLQIDADLNAALNHEQDLPSAKAYGKTKLNRMGFFWKPEGFSLVDGQELRVPAIQNIDH